MAFSMIELNTRLFTNLEDYCAKRNVPLSSPRPVRYVESSDADKQWLRLGRCTDQLVLGRRRALVAVSFEDRQIVVTVGFTFIPQALERNELNVGGGLGVLVLGQTNVEPHAPADDVLNVVSAGSRDDAGYSGHSWDLISRLFPIIRAFEVQPELGQTVDAICFLQIAIEEALLGGSWIEEELADELRQLAELRSPEISYVSLCKALSDLDPSSVFLTLYRGLEAVYAFDACNKIIRELGIQVAWDKLAAAMEDHAGWHPQEAASLQGLLAHTEASDLVALMGALQLDAGDDLVVGAARGLYRVRNALVHHRPALKRVDTSSVDWNRACSVLVRILRSVAAIVDSDSLT